MYSVSIRDSERYYLRMLLCHVPGATCFEDLRKIDGLILCSFKEAALRRGLITAENEWLECMASTLFERTGAQMRQLMVTILVFCSPADPKTIWDRFYHVLIEDIYRNGDAGLTEAECINRALLDIDIRLRSHGTRLANFPDLPQPDQIDATSVVDRERAQYDAQQQQQAADDNIGKLNDGQRAAFDAIMRAANADPTSSSTQSKIFFIDGPGGTGKTFLYNTILAATRGQNKVAIAVASSGIAALLLDGGTTAHSMFKIPLQTHQNSTCAISLQSDTAQLIQHAAIIVWDEISMVNKFCIKALDRTLRDIMKAVDPAAQHVAFGGKTIVFGGDFRQILPVVRRGRRADIIGASVTNLDLWADVQVLKLTENMRLRRADDAVNQSAALKNYGEFLLSVGNGTAPVDENGYVSLPKDICVPDCKIETLVDRVFNNLHTNIADSKWVAERAILTTTNEMAGTINARVMSMLPGETVVYESADTAVDDTHNQFPAEFLNTLQPSGMPPHRLELKVNTPVLLMRNLDIKNGLCNGTRLIVKGLFNRVIDAEIATGRNAGKRVYIPRVPITPSDIDGVPFRRVQFPIIPAFAMTINKSQGQTLNAVGVYLTDSVFSHGQLYVALSRVTCADNIHVLIDSDGKPTYKTKNIVYHEVFQ